MYSNVRSKPDSMGQPSTPAGGHAEGKTQTGHGSWIMRARALTHCTCEDSRWLLGQTQRGVADVGQQGELGVRRIEAVVVFARAWPPILTDVPSRPLRRRRNRVSRSSSRGGAGPFVHYVRHLSSP